MLEIQNKTNTTKSIYFISKIANVYIKSKSKFSQWSISLSLEGDNKNLLTQDFTNVENIGTSIKISDMFFNLPVRNKTINEEFDLEHSIKIIETWFCLLYSQITFSMNYKGQRIFISKVCKINNI